MRLIIAIYLISNILLPYKTEIKKNENTKQKIGVIRIQDTSIANYSIKDFLSKKVNSGLVFKKIIPQVHYNIYKTNAKEYSITFNLNHIVSRNSYINNKIKREIIINSKSCPTGRSLAQRTSTL